MRRNSIGWCLAPSGTYKFLRQLNFGTYKFHLPHIASKQATQRNARTQASNTKQRKQAKERASKQAKEQASTHASKQASKSYVTKQVLRNQTNAKQANKKPWRLNQGFLRSVRSVRKARKTVKLKRWV